MKNSKNFLRMLIPLVLMSSAHAAYAQLPQQPMSSAPNSPSSATRANNGELRMENGELRKISAPKDSGTNNSGSQKGDNSQFSTLNSQLVRACFAAVDELKASRELIDQLEQANTVLKTRLETEKQATALLTELNATHKSQTEALRAALAAKNEALSAKDTVIADQDKLIEALKRKRTSPWRRLGDILLGAAIFAVVK